MLDLSQGKTTWIMKDVEDAARLRVGKLLSAVMSVRETGEEIGIAKSVVQAPRCSRYNYHHFRAIGRMTRNLVSDSAA
jgi:hypothetical protein